MRDVLHDLRFAVRSPFRQPGYALAVIATLAIGIGANTAIFSVFNWILFRPLPGVTRPSDLFTIQFQTPKFSGTYFVPYVDYVHLRDHVDAFDGLAVSVPLTVHLAPMAEDDGLRLEAEIVSPNYFGVLGANPPLGRGFRSEEERAIDGVPPAVISHSLWHRQFGSDPAVLGSTIRIDGAAFIVVGVAAPGFQGRSLVTPGDIWVPVGAHTSLLKQYGRDTLTSRENSFAGDAFGRLRGQTTIEQAQTEAIAAADALPEFATRGQNRAKSSIRPVLYPGLGHGSFARQRLERTFNLLMGVVGLVLLLACANAGNLLLARTVARRREIAVRQAIGASRFRILRQHVTEGFVLSLAAGVVGIAMATWVTSLFEGMRILTFLPELEGVRIDWRVAWFALGASLVTAALFGIAPVVAGSRVDLQASLKDGLTASRRDRHLLRGGLVTLQIAVSLLLLLGAGLFLRTLQNVRALDLGFDVSGVASLMIDPSRFGHEPDRSQRTLREIAERLRTSPGIQNAALTWMTPFGNGRAEMSLATFDAPGEWHDATTSAVSSGYFETMGIPLLAGRDFTEAEYGRENTASGVVIISRGLADRIFPDGRALGSRLRVDYPKNMEVEVVGIVGDVRNRRLTADPEPFAYEPAGQRWELTWGHIVVRSNLPVSSVAAAARATLRQIDPALTPPLVEPFESLVERALAEERLFAKLSGLSAAVAAVLAGIGIYAMMAAAVGERRREFGIRMALGAAAGSVVRLVVRGAIVFGLVGTAAGLVGAYALRRLIDSRLFGVSAFDPATLATAAGAIVGVCLVASLLPAIRAARIDPVRSLRAE